MVGDGGLHVVPHPGRFSVRAFFVPFGPWLAFAIVLHFQAARGDRNLLAPPTEWPYTDH